MSNGTIPPLSMKRGDYLRGMISVGLVTGLGTVGGEASAQAASPVPTGASAKPPTQATLTANALYADQLVLSQISGVAEPGSKRELAYSASE